MAAVLGPYGAAAGSMCVLVSSILGLFGGGSRTKSLRTVVNEVVRSALDDYKEEVIHQKLTEDRGTMAGDISYLTAFLDAKDEKESIVVKSKSYMHIASNSLSELASQITLHRNTNDEKKAKRVAKYIYEYCSVSVVKRIIIGLHCSLLSIMQCPTICRAESAALNTSENEVKSLLNFMYAPSPENTMVYRYVHSDEILSDSQRELIYDFRGKCGCKEILLPLALTLKSIDDVITRVNEDKIFAIKSVSSHKYLNGARRNEICQISGRSPWCNPALQWKITKSGHRYSIKNVGSGRKLSGARATGCGRAAVMIDKGSYEWTFHSSNCGESKICIKASSGEYLDGRNPNNWHAYITRGDARYNRYLQWTFEPIYNVKLKASYIHQRDILRIILNDIQKKYDTMSHEIQILEQQLVVERRLIITDFDEEHKDENSKIVILIGNTGDGKSTFGNRLLNDESESADEGQLTVGHGADSCTQRLSNPERTQINGVSIAVIDAPGWSDTNMDDRMHENNLCAYLRGCGGINRFVLVRNASNCRFDANLQNILRRYADMFGDAFWSHLIVILTHVDSGIPERQYARGQKAETLIKRICTQFRLDRNRIDIPVFPVGLDKYKQTIHQFVECLRNSDKFECDAIKSPLDHLQDQVHQKNNERDEIERALDTIRASQESIQKEINILKYL
eukprot:482253_1